MSFFVISQEWQGIDAIYDGIIFEINSLDAVGNNIVGSLKIEKYIPVQYFLIGIIISFKYFYVIAIILFISVENGLAEICVTSRDSRYFRLNINII